MTDTTQVAGPNRLRYTIVETDVGPLISESRVSVFDVMAAHDAGDSIYEIGLTFNLSPWCTVKSSLQTRSAKGVPLPAGRRLFGGRLRCPRAGGRRRRSSGQLTATRGRLRPGG